MKVIFKFDYPTKGFEKFKKMFLINKSSLNEFERFIQELNGAVYCQKDFTLSIHYEGKQPEIECFLDLIMLGYPVLTYELMMMKIDLIKQFKSFNPLETSSMLITPRYSKSSNFEMIDYYKKDPDYLSHGYSAYMSSGKPFNDVEETEHAVFPHDPIEIKKGIRGLYWGYSSNKEFMAFTINLHHHVNNDTFRLVFQTEETRGRKFTTVLFDQYFTETQLVYFCDGLVNYFYNRLAYGYEILAFQDFLSYIKTNFTNIKL